MKLRLLIWWFVVACSWVSSAGIDTATVQVRHPSGPLFLYISRNYNGTWQSWTTVNQTYTNAYWTLGSIQPWADPNQGILYLRAAVGNYYEQGGTLVDTLATNCTVAGASGARTVYWDVNGAAEFDLVFRLQNLGNSVRMVCLMAQGEDWGCIPIGGGETADFCVGPLTTSTGVWTWSEREVALVYNSATKTVTQTVRTNTICTGTTGYSTSCASVPILIAFNRDVPNPTTVPPTNYATSTYNPNNLATGENQPAPVMTFAGGVTGAGTNVPSGVINSNLSATVATESGFYQLGEIIKAGDASIVDAVESGAGAVSNAVWGAAWAITNAQHQTSVAVTGAVWGASGQMTNAIYMWGSNTVAAVRGLSNGIGDFHHDNTNLLGQILGALTNSAAGTNEVDQDGQEAAGEAAGAAGKAEFDGRAGTLTGVAFTEPTAGLSSAWNVSVPYGAGYTINLNPFSQSWVSSLAAFVHGLVAWLTAAGVLWYASKEIIAAIRSAGAFRQATSATTTPVVSAGVALAMAGIITGAIGALPTFAMAYFDVEMGGVISNPLAGVGGPLAEALWMVCQFFPLGTMLTATLNIIAFRISFSGVLWLAQTICRFLVG